MSGLFNTYLNGTTAGEPGLRDYKHAARTFIDGLYRLSPKMNSLFHVFIELNPAIAQQDPENPLALYEIGLLAKTAQLPKFTVQNSIMNAYNRKNIVQERINYDPISLTFHDDSADVIRNFWYGYYSYYYRDADHSQALYGQDYKYKQRQSQNWGFSPKFQGPGTPNYINAIRIYSLHQKSFSSYVLFRPTIQSFQHGEHMQGDYTPLEHSMTIAYEAVQYEYGLVSAGTVTGFDIIHYDNTASPLSQNGLTNSFNLGGLIESTIGGVNNLNTGTYGTTGFNAVRAFNAFQNQDATSGVSALSLVASSILRGQNSQSTVFVPTPSSVQDGISKAVPTFPKGATPINGIQNINTQTSQIPSVNSGIIGG
jgi:hypothetical protein